MNYTHYETRTIADVIPKLNSEFFIPAIQRPYVWSADKVEKLFDSMLKEYPISTFLLWKPPADKRNSWHTYKFVQHYKQGDIRSDEADIGSIQDPHLVLDGQQRLTSIFIGLAGSYAMKPPGRRRTSMHSHVEQRLYLNLLKNPENILEDEEVEGVTYGFEFHNPEKVKNSVLAYWFPVSSVMDLKTSDALEDETDRIIDHLTDIGATNEAKKNANRVLRRLRTVIWEHRCISACVVQNVSYDQVLDIFVRANEGGEPLSKSDLLMSLVTLNWKNFDARAEIVTFLSELNDDLTTPNKLNRDFILRAALLFCGHAFVFKVDSFTRDNLAQIEANWVAIKSGLRKAVVLVNSFGLSNEKGNLTSINSVMPIAFYIFTLLRKLGSDDVVDAVILRSRRSIRIWLSSCQFTGIFGGAADQTVVRATRTIREKLEVSDEFPARSISEAISIRRKNALFDQERIDSFLALTGHDRQCRVYLQMFYPHDEWEVEIRSRELVFSVEDAKVSARDMDERIDQADDIPTLPNMVLLSREEHEELAVFGPTVWLESRDPVQRRFHMLPRPEDYDVTNFTSFFKARRKIIEAWLKENVGNRPAPERRYEIAVDIIASV